VPCSSCFWRLDFGVWRFEFGILDLGTGVGGRSSSGCGGGGGGGAPTVWLSSASIWGAKSTHTFQRGLRENPKG